MYQRCSCERYGVEIVNIKVVINKTPWETYMYEDMKRNAVDSWLLDINREEAKRGRPQW